jgi:hypothetical protein
LKPSALPSARPPEITRAAVCRSGRSFLAADTDTKRVCVGSATATLAVSIGAAAEPLPAASKEAARTGGCFGPEKSLACLDNVSI